MTFKSRISLKTNRNKLCIWQDKWFSGLIMENTKEGRTEMLLEKCSNSENDWTTAEPTELGKCMNI